MISLFQPQFEYKVDCFMDDKYKHNILVMNNLRVKDIANDYEMYKNGINNNNVENIIDSFDYIQYGCDWCRGLMTEWEFIYSCFDKHWDEKHDICLFCTNTVIVLNKELNKLLSNILKHNLNQDCIQEIVHFAIGKVLYIDNNNIDNNDLDLMVIDENTKSNSRKRKLGDEDIPYNDPDIKRRKLN